MLYLLLAILCSAAIAIIFKLSEAKEMNRYVVLACNYLAASIVSGAFLLCERRETPWPASVGLSASLREIGNALVRTKPPALSDEAALVWAVGLGLSVGLIFFLGFLYYQLSVRRHGVGLAGTFAKLGIFLPMVLSLIIWRDRPTDRQWTGITLAATAILAVNWPRRDKRFEWRLALILLGLFSGLAEFSAKIFEKYGSMSFKSLFLLSTFATALVCAGTTAGVFGKRFSLRDVVTGLVLGLPNLFTAVFLIAALHAGVSAPVAYSAFGAGTIVIVTLAGALVWRERLGRREVAAIGLTIVALVVINL